MSLLYVSLGANIGDREGTLRRAVSEMERRIGPCVALSRMYETAPVGFDSPHAFLNAAAAFRVTACAQPNEAEGKAPAFGNGYGQNAWAIYQVDQMEPLDYLSALLTELFRTELLSLMPLWETRTAEKQPYLIN